MTPNEYSKALEKAVSDLESRMQTRDILNAEIAGLRETVRVLANRTHLTNDGREAVSRLLDMVDYATPSLADSIRAALTRTFPKAMTAVEVRNALEESQFNFDDFSNPLSACHAALKRMLSDKEVEAEQTKDGKTAYRRVVRLPPPPKVAIDKLAEFLKRVEAAGRFGGIVPGGQPKK
jgi:DNA repair ATPase RecN